MSDSLTTVPQPALDVTGDEDVAEAPHEEPADDGGDDAPAARRRLPRLPRLRPRRPGPLAGLVVLALAAGGLAGWSGWELREADRRQQDGEAAVVAGSEVVNLLWTVDAASSKDVFATLLASSTGPLRSQLSQASGSFQQVLTQQKVSSKGSIVEAGLTELQGDRATVLVAANATIVNAEGKSEVRQYRMRGTLQRADGQWLVANLEFVP